MSLPLGRVARVATQRSSCDHIWAHMPNAWQEIWHSVPARTREQLCYRLLFAFGIGIELALSLLSEAAAIAAETDSAANQFGAHRRAHNTRAAHFRFCGPWLPLAHLSDLWIGEQL